METAFDRVAYHRTLGLQVTAHSAEQAQLRLPFAAANSNPGGALHGGVTASAIVAAGGLAGWCGVERTPQLSGAPIDVALVYLAAAINEDIVVDARLLRRGKELAFVDVAVRTDASKAIAHGLLTYRIAPPSPADRLRSTLRTYDAALGVVPSFAKFFVMAPFIKQLGVVCEHAADGVARTRATFTAPLADDRGALHDGTVAAVIDTTAAMAAWSLVPLDPRNKASTVDLHVSWCDAAPGEDIVAVAETLQRRNEIFIVAVAVSAASSGRVLAHGTVTYRIVVPEE